MLNTALFALVLLLIAPSTRSRIGAAMSGIVEWISKYQPFSFLVVLVVLAAPIVCVWMIRSAPERVEPPTPIAHYRLEEETDDEA